MITVATSSLVLVLSSDELLEIVLDHVRLGVPTEELLDPDGPDTIEKEMLTTIDVSVVTDPVLGVDLILEFDDCVTNTLMRV